MFHAPPRQPLLACVALALSLALTACGSSDPSQTEAASTDDGGAATASQSDAGAERVNDPALTAAQTASDYLGSYELMNEEFGTMVTVTVDATSRTIVTNALPDHETGNFPNAGNPNSISAQDLTWQFPAQGVYTGAGSEPRSPGVAVNGVKFEPGTAETVTCASGERLRVEALQDLFDLGLDFNNAHVQPTGEYHYHGASELLVEAYDADEDLVHIGFAADGFLIYYSKSGAYSSGYVLSTETRTGTDCAISLPGGDSFDLAGTSPDGTYQSDWIFDPAGGDLDECNGMTIDGEYLYVMTEEYPYISRCLNGEAGAGAGAGGQGGGDTPDQGQQNDAGEEPDLAAAAETLGVTEDELRNALGGRPPDLDAAAATLGVSVEALTAALPAPPGQNTPAEVTAEPSPESASATTAAGAGSSGPDLGLFFDGALANDVATVPCTLADGTATTCYQITVVGYPVDAGIGPFCPETVDTSADDAGLWFDGNGLYDLDGDFILGLAELYDDDNWLLYNDDGSVNITDTPEAFDAAARPNVAPEYQNHCVEGRIEWLDGGEPIPTTALIPTSPILATTTSQAGRGDLGVTLNGVTIAVAAPVDAILGAYTIAAFDDCGGHINPVAGYHLHGAVGCGEVPVDGHAAIFGYAMDGFALHSPYEADGSTPSDLDSCGGHSDDELGYHYHASPAAENAVINCFSGQTAS